MSKTCSIFLFATFLLLSIMAAADEGQYLILNAQYGNERNHVDITNRLRDLARRDRPFRVSYESMAVDPDRGHAKMLRVFARGPRGEERIFDFPDGTVFDGAQFRSWKHGNWGNEPWQGDWYGSANNDAGQFLILSAQYGTARSHVDVTRRLKELASADVRFRMGNSTFGIDPDPGVVKALRIYARGPNGRERMFEYREGSVVDGTQFRAWGRGEWGDRDHWSGRWEGEEHDRDRD